MFGRDLAASVARLAQTPNAHPRLRPYQKEANDAVEAAIAQQKRQMLVAMATGCGKTFLTVNQIYRMMKAGVAKRVLFLVDRRALAAQAVRAFASFEAEPNLKFDSIYEVYSQRFHREDLGDDVPFDPKVLPTSYLLDPKPSHAFVYVCTIQRMTINLFGRARMLGTSDDEGEDDDAERLDIPIHAFDLVIADECHRGYTTAVLSVWRDTLDHFDAIKVGLTATPAAHTVAYFKEIVYRYEYSRAVREGYLVDYDPVNVHSDVRLEGMVLKGGEQVGRIDPTTGVETFDTLEDEIAVDPGEVEQKATSPESNRKILEEVKKYAEEHEAKYHRFPKTLIFAVNDLPHTSHADSLVDIARDVFGRGDTFVQKITGHADRPLQRIREFRNRQQTGVVVTVDMLSTGVDIPDLEFIVFLRPVRSRILFEQMMGRGTRKGERFPDKSHFTVFDCFDGTLLQRFGGATGITAEPPVRDVRPVSEVIEDIWQNRDRDYNVRCLVKRLQRVNKEMSGEARELFAAYIPEGDIGKFAGELAQRLKTDFSGTMKMLRDAEFQRLLVEYPRPKRTFFVGYDTVDNVTSQRLIHDGTGKVYTANDYLAAFERFIRENSDQIAALSILLDRPRDWSTDALAELRRALAGTPQRFKEKDLQIAHEACYHKALVEIISMVKRAAREQEPLLTAEERAERALEAVMAGGHFTPEQRLWLLRIKEHLVDNPSLGKDDFETMPIFTRFGGWGRATKDFGAELPRLIRRFNEAMAA